MYDENSKEKIYSLIYILFFLFFITITYYISFSAYFFNSYFK